MVFQGGPKDFPGDQGNQRNARFLENTQEWYTASRSMKHVVLYFRACWMEMERYKRLVGVIVFRQGAHWEFDRVAVMKNVMNASHVYRTAMHTKLFQRIQVYQYKVYVYITKLYMTHIYVNMTHIHHHGSGLTGVSFVFVGSSQEKPPVRAHRGTRAPRIDVAQGGNPGLPTRGPWGCCLVYHLAA